MMLSTDSSGRLGVSAGSRSVREVSSQAYMTS
jgi:hypothetical protein